MVANPSFGSYIEHPVLGGVLRSLPLQIRECSVTADPVLLVLEAIGTHPSRQIMPGGGTILPTTKW